MENDLLKKKIMRRVYAIWFFKKATNSFTLEFAAFIGLLFWLASYVSFRQVFGNASSALNSPSSFAGFFTSAFSATEFISKILFLAIALLSVLLLKDSAPAFSRALFKIKNSFRFALN